MILRDLFLAATGGSMRHEGRADRYTAFASDSREVAQGDLFVAVRGMHADGHDFVGMAVAQGAAGVIVEAGHPLTDTVAWLDQSHTRDATIIVVADVRAALRDYAAAVLRLWQPRVIAVTGSAGKTTTKEAIATVLSRHASTFRSWRNYNDLLGLPLSLGRLEPHHEFAVVELGSEAPGELATLLAMCQPEIVVILNDFDAPSMVSAQPPVTETSLVATVLAASQAEQTLVLNANPEHLPDEETLSQRQPDPLLPAILWFGETFYHGAQPRLVSLDSDMTPLSTAATHLQLALRSNDEAVARTYPFYGLHGAHWGDAVLAALTVTTQLGIPLPSAAAVLADLEPLPGRMRVLEGRDVITIIDDTHNALPQATLAALEFLTTSAQRQHDAPRIAVLGDITLRSPRAHQAERLLAQAMDLLTDWLVTRGEGGAHLAQLAIANGMKPERVIITFAPEDTMRAVTGIAAGLLAPPVILVKGAPEMRMEAITAQLLTDATPAPQVLDRQRQIWQREIVREPARPTWLEIDLGAIGENTQAIATLVGPQVAVMATLKADAYGHGALKVAHTVLRNGATWLGVATLSEATPLRQAGIHAPILVYGYLPPWQAREAVKHAVRVTVYEMDAPRALSRAASALGETVRLHVKIDSGMGRLGLRAEDPAAIVAFLRELRALPQIVVEGIYTHLATADERDQTYANKQLARFQVVLAALDAAGLRPPIVHAANSAATLALPAARFDLVRPGIALYGLHPSTDVPLPPAFRAAMSFKTQIAQIKELPPGEGISYGITYVTDAPERIATLPVGYADGFRRGPAHWGDVLIRGQRAPIRGRVCMDQVMVSVQHIPDARAGDEVVLLGAQGAARLTAEEVAARLGTSNYEVVSALLARVPRISG